MEPVAEAIAALGYPVLAVEAALAAARGAVGCHGTNHPRRGESKSLRHQRSLTTAGLPEAAGP
jgi:hypothetical protein